MAEPLLTILHASDLHIGSVDICGDNQLDATVRQNWRSSSVFQGYLGHTWVALRQLAALWREIRARDPKAVFVMTGDATTTGSAAQFVNAFEQYLFHSLPDPQGGIGVGLRLAETDTRFGFIPGNHDHWPGRPCQRLRLLTCMLGGPSPNFSAYFPHRPIIPLRIDLHDRCTLVLAGLDSDDQVLPYWINRAFARGSFKDQCDGVWAQLGQRPPKELRVLLMHHSAQDERTGSFSLRIDQESRKALKELVRKSGIAMVLTGHHHWVDCEGFVGRPVIVREARCGTTTARDYVEADWGVDWVLHSNTALVHQLYDEAGSIRWETEVRTRDAKMEGFVKRERVEFGCVWP